MNDELAGQYVLLAAAVVDELPRQFRGFAPRDIQPTTERLKTSRMTYRQQEVHLAGPRSFMMSQLQSRLGDVASSSGFA
jgi:hypothetical protein